MDYGLTSCPTAEEAIKVMKDTQEALKKYGNLRLHKFASNSFEVMSAFPSSDLATNLKDLDLEANTKPLQRSLGLIWDLNADRFIFQLSPENKPVTPRGILSTVNSIYDLLGFLAPVIIQGKLILRKLTSSTFDWDDPVPDDIASEWESWRDALKVLETLRIPRTYVSCLSQTVTKELHVYSDNSEKAIAAVAYLRTLDKDGNPDLGFVLGKAKVAPTNGHTIPRLELCAAVLAVEIAQCALEQLDLPINSIKYYTDSKVVLGYITNDTRRCYIYVGNRVERIRKFSLPEQWNYVNTDHNSADSAIRSLPASEIHNSEWLLGPKHLLTCESSKNPEGKYQLVDPDSDGEIRPDVRSDISVAKTLTTLDCINIGTERFQHFSTWKALIRGIAFLKRSSRSRLNGKSRINPIDTVLQDAEDFVLKSVQTEVYQEEIDCLRHKTPVGRRSTIANLNPFLDEKELLRVGGRIAKSDLSLQGKMPLIIPGRHYIATHLVRHHHEKIKNQGRHFTDGAIRSAGFWITGIKRLISSFIRNCVTCRKLRGKEERQIMSDLPEDRLDPAPPFTNVGVDAFGPWTVISRRNRGGYANSKRWAILFTYLVTRAVHIELVEEMSSSAFINSVKRFQAIRGEAKIFRSDRGTNFIGAVDDLKVIPINVEDRPIKRYLSDFREAWIFNPPHSSHMGGVWECMIGMVRRILDSILLGSTGDTLTHSDFNKMCVDRKQFLT